MQHAALPALPPAALPLLRVLWAGDWVLERLLPPLDADQVSVPLSVLRRPEEGAATLYLPDGMAANWLASVAHVAAHRRFGGPAQARKGLKPVQMALLGVLEDARVEWLACEELPGLREQWRPFHTGDNARTGQGFEDLLARLSACLLDPALQDPHPWIARVRQLFFESDGRTLALRTSAQVREAASRLGNDIGQMRLPFNARTYRVHAGYRDDNTHLWLPSDEDRTAMTLPETAETDPSTPPAPASPEEWVLEKPVATYPEWNHRSGHYRPGWTRVYEVVVPPDPRVPRASATAVQRLVRLCRASTPSGRGKSRDQDGDELHAGAMIDSAVAWRRGQAPDPRIWCRPQPPLSTQGVLLLVDASVSTAADLARWQVDVQQAATALQRLGHRSAVWAFGSDGRHRVRMQRLKDWTDACETVPWGGLQAGGSTRLGAALRHAAHLCRQGLRHLHLDRCTVLLLSDGELHDIDVHDSAYLPADLVHATRELHAQGIGLQALLSGPALAVRRALGADRCRQAVSDQWGAVLPQALSGRRG